MRSLLVLPVVLPAVVAACSSDTGPPLTTATSLSCPAPGALPFRLMSTGFQKSANQSIATDNPRNKDQAGDMVGNIGGPMASVYIDDAQQPTATTVDYHGVKALTAADNGISDTPLAGENVSLWAYDATGMKWQALGRTTTDVNGAYDLPSTGYVASNTQPVYAMLEATGSCAEHFDYLYTTGEKVVVTDIDGTLTASDSELPNQIVDITYVPKIMGAADKLMAAWNMKGYPIIYLTARPHLLRAETRLWLDDIKFPPGALITENGGKTDDVYKTIWLQRMVQTFGWDIVAAYGNAVTDITAYQNAGIPKSQTFIVGPMAGTQGTVAIQNNDFTDHINTFVAAQPPNQ